MIDIIATGEDGVEQLLAETAYIMVARNGTASAAVPGLLLANEEVSTFLSLNVFLVCFSFGCSLVSL